VRLRLIYLSLAFFQCAGERRAGGKAIYPGLDLPLRCLTKGDGHGIHPSFCDGQARNDQVRAQIRLERSL
jgi:hypothetical protein